MSFHNFICNQLKYAASLLGGGVSWHEMHQVYPIIHLLGWE